MSNRKRKKKFRAERSNPAGAEPEKGTIGSPRRRLPGAFFWGLAGGFLATLAAVVAIDLGWIPVSNWTHPPAGAETLPEAGADSERVILLDGAVPPGGILLVDGVERLPAADGSTTRVTVPVEARSLEVRGPGGTWWATPLGPESGDTLRPVWSGEIVVEAPSRMHGASLFVDGQPAGRVPGVAAGLAPGWHVVSVREGDETLFEDARVVAAGEVVALSLPPIPPRGTARLIVRTRRMDSSGVVETHGRPVRVNGESVGETPVERTVEAGYYSVAVQEPDRPMRVEVVRVEAGATRYIDFEENDETHPQFELGPAVPVRSSSSVIVPVRYLGTGTPLQEAVLHVARASQSGTVDIPLVASSSDPETWMAAVPRSSLGRGALRMFASGTDVLGRSGWSEVAPLER